MNATATAKLDYCRVVDGCTSFRVESEYGNAIRHWDDGDGRLWCYRSADFDRAVVRARSFEDALECVYSECLHDADPNDVLEAETTECWEGVAIRSGVPCDPEVGITCYAAVSLNGEQLEPLTWRKLAELEWRLIAAE